MVAWIDTAEGRKKSAMRGVWVALLGTVLYIVGYSLSKPLAWFGIGLAVLGGSLTIWAFVHPTQPDLPMPPRSNECYSEKHGQCSKPRGLDPPDRCGCWCHENPDGNGGVQRSKSP
jgi:hypothetical protein